MPNSGCVAQAAAAIPAPARKLRLETPSMFLLFLDDNRGGHTNFIMLDGGRPIQAVTSQIKQTLTDSP
jgi:hypothetical protein